jgi:hypothetical protein
LIIVPAFGHGRTRKNTEDFYFFSVFHVLPWLKSPSVAGAMIKADRALDELRARLALPALYVAGFRIQPPATSSP